MVRRKLAIPLAWLRQTAKDLRVLGWAFVQFYNDNGFFLSSGITFNILINLIPFIMLLLALIGTYLYNDQDVLNQVRHYLRSIAPSLDPKITRNLLGIIQNRKIVGIIGFGGLIWVSTLVFSSLRIALNMVFRVKRGRGILLGTGVDLLMILLVTVLLLLSMVLTSAVTFIEGYESLLPIDIGLTLRWVLKYPLPFLFTWCMFFLIYKIIPDRTVRFNSALRAALFASLLWELAKHLFGLYVAHLAGYSILYGSLSTVAIFIFWVYYSAAILLVGGEFAYLLEKERMGSMEDKKR